MLDLALCFTSLDAQEWSQVMEQKPVARAERDGMLCDVYRWNRAGAEPLGVEALVAAERGQLRSVEVFRLREGRRRPIEKLVVAQLNTPVNEDLFRIADTLTVDGRIGKIVDAQGVITLKSMAASRWTPVQAGEILKPGDWVRTDLRGANATLLRLLPSTRVTLGPGTLVELQSPRQLKLLSGVVKIVADSDAAVQVQTDDGQQLAVSGTHVVQLQDRRLVPLQQEPAWIAGFEGATTQEAIGSLVANIDGRDVPLTVGYHKVTVDIRDQIARTVIEESFVNHTNARLEGVFYFPLPQDASISGFGMWIGDELVEADVVEKQRAREIYETILREKRDPGLLEWTGGNLFKARVFPIFPRSEKRIKITYTQVLPLQGNSYRYGYSLQSEMLKQHPLSELAIDVKVSSSVPLADVECPTHTTRDQQDRSLGACRVRGPGVHAGSRLRGGGALAAPTAASGSDPAPAR